eukprot:TRINITY_DN30347_c0_g2_i1.p1 TRINITY_DN30347_c0_g2~~TRINITY_DN30347_c0_g2_i1.p1  ORF type:complete len:338 (-),score=31.09 TRINITY_DN30347_c0_g2_i1:225-1238(-)
MGAGAASQRQLLGSVNSGRNTLSGTFLAEKTHGDPPRYTLISLSSALGPSGFTNEVPSNSSSSRSKGSARDRFTAKPFQLPGLSDIDALLAASDKIGGADGANDADSDADDAAACAGSPSASSARDAKSKAKAKAKAKARAKAKNKSRNPHAALSPRKLSPAERDAAFSRLSMDERPWVASKTDAQLLQYLSKRSGDDGICSTDISTTIGGSPSTSLHFSSCMSPMPSIRSSKQPRYKTHRELFDTCLERPGSRSSRNVMSPIRPHSRSGRDSTSPVPSQHKKLADGDSPWREGRGANWLGENEVSRPASRRLSHLVEDIVVLPEDPVEAFLQQEHL